MFFLPKIVGLRTMTVGILVVGASLALLTAWRGFSARPGTPYDPGALTEAVRENNAPLARNLLEQGGYDVDAGIEQTNIWSRSERYSLLSYAAEEGNSGIVDALLRHGAGVNRRNGEGETALFLAKNTAVVDLLLAAGADVRLKDQVDADALFCQVYSRHYGVVRRLMQLRPDVHNALQYAIGKDDEDAFRLLTEDRRNLEIEDDEGLTPAMQPLGEGADINQLQSSMWLLKHGADVNHRSHTGQTPLMRAPEGWRYPEPCPPQSLDAIRWILNKGADVNARDSRGRTALMAAAAHVRPEIVRLLLDAGADARLRDRNGKTALNLAWDNRDSFGSQHNECYVPTARLLRRAAARQSRGGAHGGVKWR